MYLTPLDEPHRDPGPRQPTRPISLLCALAKAREAAVHHRLLAFFEPRLDERQHACRGSRGTETHTPEPYDFLPTAGAEGDFAYLASVAVDSASGPVPHSLLIKTFREVGARVAVPAQLVPVQNVPRAFDLLTETAV